MLNITEETAIQKVLDDLTSRNEVFTSVHVANEVKKAGTWIRNRDVASYIRMYFPYQYGGEYDSTIGVEIGNGIRATVYHPIGTDPVDKVGVVSAMTPDEFDKMHGDHSVADLTDTSPKYDGPFQTMAVASDDAPSNSSKVSDAKSKIADFFNRNLNFPKVH